MHIKEGYPTEENTQNGKMYTCVYYGTLDEMRDLQARYPIGSSGEQGVVAQNTIKPSRGFWELEIREDSNCDGDTVEGPDTSYGKKSAQVHGSMLAMPLEAHPNYRTNWNYFLFAAPGVSGVPSWWETAEDPVLDEAIAEEYQWGRSTAELPVLGGKKWHVVAAPTMPGVQTYDMASYTMTEGARYRSFRSAVIDMGRRLNKIVQPFTRVPELEIEGATWKCDDVAIQWTGKYWIGTYTYTLSGPGGWNDKLYTR